MFKKLFNQRIRYLRIKTEIQIAPTTPFHFVGTVYKPSHFPSADNTFDGKIYYQTMYFEENIIGFSMEDVGTKKRPLINVTVYSKSKLEDAFIYSLKRELEFRFDLRADLREFNKICRGDAVLKPVYQRWRGMRVSAAASLYEFLIITTVLQNATVRRSVQMLDKLFNTIGSQVKFNNKLLFTYWDSSELNRLTEEQLRSMKLGYRAKILKLQAVPFVEQRMEEQSLRFLPSEVLRPKLLSLYGVGPASVGYLMFEVFKRYDALEYISPWEQKIFSMLLFKKELVSEKVILAYIEQKWGRWKSLASHYLFEDLFWRRRNESIPWLEKLIRL